jgi:hypothetical protein
VPEHQLAFATAPSSAAICAVKLTVAEKITMKIATRHSHIVKNLMGKVCPYVRQQYVSIFLEHPVPPVCIQNKLTRRRVIVSALEVEVDIVRDKWP